MNGTPPITRGIVDLPPAARAEQAESRAGTQHVHAACLNKRMRCAALTVDSGRPMSWARGASCSSSWPASPAAGAGRTGGRRQRLAPALAEAGQQLRPCMRGAAPAASLQGAAAPARCRVPATHSGARTAAAWRRHRAEPGPPPCPRPKRGRGRTAAPHPVPSPPAQVKGGQMGRLGRRAGLGWAGEREGSIRMQGRGQRCSSRCSGAGRGGLLPDGRSSRPGGQPSPGSNARPLPSHRPSTHRHAQVGC